ncbi:hypothetical protein [Streptomyces sp. SM1]|uniref:hypothetical protein n=1 Tax=Streptomyces sp. SM1 TaxID=402229 RepID=UPI000CD5607A|nr:hypothetical protein [Streptomyces sp. SM1]
MTHPTVIPPVDRTPTGHLPAVVQAALVDPPAGPCPVFRDCVEAGPHDHHFNHNARVRSDGGELLLDAGMVAFSEGDDDRPVIYVGGEDFADAASVHAATAKLRQLLDEVDRMAVRVFADHEKRA